MTVPFSRFRGDGGRSEDSYDEVVATRLAPADLAALRAAWWRLARLRHRLPVEPGVIVLEGKRP